MALPFLLLSVSCAKAFKKDLNSSRRSGGSMMRNLLPNSGMCNFMMWKSCSFMFNSLAMPEQTTLGAFSPQQLTQKKDWRQPCGLHNNLSRIYKDMHIRSCTFCVPLWHFCEAVVRSG